MSVEVTRHGRSAVVIGGGIGGLTAAIALRGTGWNVTVLEQAGRLEPVGAGLSIWPNALRALDLLGLADGLRSRAMTVMRTGIRRSDGRWLSRIDGAQTLRRHGAPLVAAARSELVDLLAGALPAGAIRLGVTVTEVEPGDVGARATVHCGAESLSADLIVAADGLRSRVRERLLPGATAPRYAGYTAWRALVHAPQVAAGPGCETWGRGERFGIVPVSADTVYYYATANVPAGQRAADELAEVRRRFGRWHDPIPALLDATEPDLLLRHDIFALGPSLKHYHHGRVALLGDAAHGMEPNQGQGACLAMEDAVVLAHVLADKAVPVTAALAGYSQVRAGRAARLARQSRAIGKVAQSASPVPATIRDTLAWLIPDALARNGFDSAADWHPPALPVLPTAAV